MQAGSYLTNKQAYSSLPSTTTALHLNPIP